MLKRNFLIKYFLFVSFLSQGQDTVRFSITNDLGLIDYSKVQISNADKLNPFFQKLSQLKKSGKGIVSILHIGDSHVQGDYLTHKISQNFQLEFGNAGRGFLTPNQVAQTNEGASYYSKSSGKWEAKRMVFIDQPLPIGLGGVTVKSFDENAAIRITLKNYPGLDYSFNKVTVFLQQDDKSYHVAVQDTLNRSLAFVGNFTESSTIHCASANLPYLVNDIQFQSIKSLPQQIRTTYFGFSFENGKPGILYHSIGANGAKYRHYLAAEYFVEQTSALKPDLIVIALGTNEALDYPYSDPKFKEDVKSLIDELQKRNQGAQFIISIHPDSYRKKTKRNPGVNNIRKSILEVAEQKHLSVFDLYEACGGNHSADDWKKSELLRDDGVHFTRVGYELQGDAFYLALMKAFNQYVSNRRK